MIKEANITYTPEKVDQFVLDLTKELDRAKTVYETARNKVMNMSVGEVLENLDGMKAYKDKLEKAVEMFNKLHTKYFDIVETFDFYGMPANVRALEKLVDKLDNYYSDLSKVEDVVDDMISAASRLTNLYSD